MLRVVFHQICFNALISPFEKFRENRVSVQQNIYLIGLMGAGKTTIGRNLARLMKLAFIDTDKQLEQRTGVSVSYIFEMEGEEGFRERESNLLKEIGQKTAHVVSTGGGIVLRPENRSMMRRSGKVIYLSAPFAVLWMRLRRCKKRPLLATEDPQSTLRQLMELREPLYREAADITMDVDTGSAINMARSIRQKLQA